MKKCSVQNCKKKADYRVMLYDVYLPPCETSVFIEQDHTCPFICANHMAENEKKAEGTREARGFVSYPYTNKHLALGFTIYLPLDLTTIETV